MSKLLLIGCGNMGSAILRGLLAQNMSWQIQVVDHHTENVQPFLDHVTYTEMPEDIKVPDVILLAVKPQAMDQLLIDLTLKDFNDSLVISIAAGKNLAYFQQALPRQAALIRAMPNLPASVGAGITAAIANTPLTVDHKEMATQILSAAGALIWLGDESQMDAVTALSGSGPAYVFHLCEVLSMAGIKLGLPAEMATSLARETIIGSAALLNASHKSAAQLRKDVTSPGGTTEAALSVLIQDEAMKVLFEKALKAAAERSQNLS